MNGTFDCLALIFHFLFVMFAAFGQRSIRPGTFGGEFRLGLEFDQLGLVATGDGPIQARGKIIAREIANCYRAEAGMFISEGTPFGQNSLIARLAKSRFFDPLLVAL